MGYATVMNVPRIANYKEAYSWWNNVKPVRGRTENDPNTPSRPLGERRDVDTYSIRKNVWTEAVECVLYQTPVVTFTPDDEVKIKLGRWSSASTCQFISRVLGSISASRVRGDVVLGFVGGGKAMVRDHEELVLVKNSHGHWQPKQKQTLYDYRVSRKEANNVRKSVSQFHDYMAGVIKLKSTEYVIGAGTAYEERRQVVVATYGEMIGVLGKETTHDGRFRPAVGYWVGLDTKPKHYRPEAHKEVWANYHERTEKFFDLVRNDQDDNCRHQNYWIAFNILFSQGQQLWWRDSMDMQVSLGVEFFDKLLDKVLFTMFADKVFKKAALAEGKVPTGKYADCVLTEED